MSKEIYINTGTSFQQQYTARQPAIGTAPITAQYDAQGNANSQTPFTYQSRSPYTFQSQVNAQTPYIANTQQPYPYIAHTQQPYIANAQTPYPYIAQKQTSYPYIASAQSPYPYIAQSRTPYIAQGRQPFPYSYQAAAQTPYQASAQQPYPYPANAQQPYPYIANARQPYPYIANKQTPYPASSQAPYPANSQQPARQPISTQTPGGSDIQHTKLDHTQNSPGTPFVQATETAQVYASESAFGYIVWRRLKLQWRIHWWRHSNGYGYAYWYVRRGTPSSGVELGGITAQNSLVYLTQGNVPYNQSNWRLVEQWSFWTANTWPDSLSLGSSLSVTATLGSFPLATTSGSDTTNSAEGHKEYVWECEEGFEFPNGGIRDLDITMVPTAIKSGYPNLTGATHTVDMYGRITCYWNCFLAGSKVLLEDNTTKNIEDIEVGDKVMGKDGLVNAVKEIHTTNKTDKAVYTINGSFKTTAGHPLLTTEGWKSCDGSAGQQGHPELNITELAIGDKLLKDAGNANGDSVEENVDTITVATPSGTTTFYNLDVTDSPSGNDTYVVDNYIVHNK